MPTLKLEIVTPDAKTFSDDIAMVVIPAVEGEMGVLPQHVPLMTGLKPGELKVTTAQGQNIYLAVGEGFVEITQDRVSVLTDMAVEEKEIDEAATAEAVRRAEEALKHPNIGHEEVAAVQASLQKSLAKLQLKRRKHR